MLAALASAALLFGSGTDDPLWRQIEHINRGNSYTFALRDGSCQEGVISKFSIGSLEIIRGPEHGSTVPVRLDIARNEILYIGKFREVGAVNPYSLVFSARNSWHDVGALRIDSREHVRIVLKSGKQLSGIPKSWSETQVSLGSGRSTRDIPREQVDKVYYVRLKPVSMGTEYASLEAPYLLPFDPEMWPYWFNIGVHMDVLLYDASKPDEKGAFTCAAAS